MPEAQRGAGGVFSSRNSRPPGSAGSTGLTVLFPGKPLGLSAGGKEPGRGRGGESVGPCVRGAAAGLPGCEGDGWTGRAAHQMMAPRPAPWNGRDAAPGQLFLNESLGRTAPGGCPRSAHWGPVRGNRADVSELVGGEWCSLALPAGGTCFLRAHHGLRGRPPTPGPGASPPCLSGGVCAAMAGQRA